MVSWTGRTPFIGNLQASGKDKKAVTVNCALGSYGSQTEATKLVRRVERLPGGSDIEGEIRRMGKS